MRKYLNEVGVTAQQAIERVVRERGWPEGKLKVPARAEIDLADAHDT
jgi:hypothetical protein